MDLSAHEGERIGLINHVVLDNELDLHVYNMAKRLVAGATKAIRWTKKAANIGLKQIAHSVMDTSISYEMLTFATNDHREAVAAFQEKRNPCLASCSTCHDSAFKPHQTRRDAIASTWHPFAYLNSVSRV